MLRAPAAGFLDDAGDDLVPLLLQFEDAGAQSKYAILAVSLGRRNDSVFFEMLQDHFILLHVLLQ